MNIRYLQKFRTFFFRCLIFGHFLYLISDKFRLKDSDTLLTHSLSKFTTTKHELEREITSAKIIVVLASSRFLDDEEQRKLVADVVGHVPQEISRFMNWIYTAVEDEKYRPSPIARGGVEILRLKITTESGFLFFVSKSLRKRAMS